MIYLFTGVPGAGKTLNAIKTVLDDKTLNDGNRPVFYFGIKELTLEWSLLTDNDVRHWFDLPDGSIIIIDECQDYFSPRRAGSDVPPIVSNLNTHRHKGFDIILITQHPMLLDNAVRRVVGTHRHLDRRYGMKRITQYSWQTCINDPTNYHDKKKSDRTTFSMDKKIFGLYKSAEVHTHKTKIPKKVIAVMGVVLFFVFVLLYGISHFVSKSTSPNKIAESTKVSTEKGSSIIGSPLSSSTDSASHDLVNYQARIEGQPWTAPVYDEIREVKTYPRPQCLINESKDTCRCYSQQATLLSVADVYCRSIVKNGYFDSSRQELIATDQPRNGVMIDGETFVESSALSRVNRAIAIYRTM